MSEIVKGCQFEKGRYVILDEEDFERVRPESTRVIETFERPLDLATYKDEYREGLQQIIDAKIAGREVVAPAVEESPKVVNLMDALRKSLDTVSAKKKAPARAEIAKAPARLKRA